MGLPIINDAEKINNQALAQLQKNTTQKYLLSPTAESRNIPLSSIKYLCSLQKIIDYSPDKKGVRKLSFLSTTQLADLTNAKKTCMNVDIFLHRHPAREI